MKRVIEGMCYDTEKAEKVEAWGNRLSSSDFHYCRETLYKTKNGRFFLHGDGGALTQWSEPVGNNGRGGCEKIVPMTSEEALEWCENREVDADTISEHFTIIDA